MTHAFQESGPGVTGECQLKGKSGDLIATLFGEFVFTYGMFGFGESYQVICCA